MKIVKLAQMEESIGIQRVKNYGNMLDGLSFS